MLTIINIVTLLSYVNMTAVWTNGNILNAYATHGARRATLELSPRHRVVVFTVGGAKGRDVFHDALHRSKPRP